jgi:hypothetical protein
MFFDRYLNEIYLGMLYEKYEEWYLNQIDKDNFKKIYELLKKYKFYFIEDIIINYLELFSYEEKILEDRILKLKDKLGDNFVWEIGNNLLYLEELLD